MRSGFRYIFIGLLFIFVEIQITFDILPDPIGFYLIYVGLQKIVGEQPIDSLIKSGSRLAILLCIFSIPSILSSNMSFNELNFNFDPLQYGYRIFMQVLYLMLAYYIFKIMLELSKTLYVRIHNQTRIIFRLYMTALLTINIFSPFFMNFRSGDVTELFFIIGIFVLISHIMFIIQVFRFRKIA